MFVHQFKNNRLISPVRIKNQQMAKNQPFGLIFSRITVIPILYSVRPLQAWEIIPELK